MRQARITVLTAAVAVAVSVVSPMASANAEPCSDVEVVFARGTTEPVGLGGTGDAFVSALRAQLVDKTVAAYAVDYPATTEFSTAVQGIADARQHILATAAGCPATKMVLGGFSQGAAVIGFVTTDVIPDGVSPADVPAPMPPATADHVAAVALFGKPSPRFMRAISKPDIAVGPQYAAKTIDLCMDNDLVCARDGRSFAAHNQYTDSGLVNQGATFAADQLRAGWAADALTQLPPEAPPVSSPHTPPVALPGPAAPPTPPAPAPVAPLA